MANKAQIVTLMISDARTEWEVGFNSALIQLLKQDYSPGINTLKDAMSANAEADKLKSILGPSIFNMLTRDVIRNLIEHKANRAKLNAVKTLKEHTGLGLKEAKDFMDSWF